jgi:ABC-type nitrate/sulfonate/bicarbonate transport system substrate-binding protein
VVKLLGWMLAMAAAASLLAGCGEGSEAETATNPLPLPYREAQITLDGIPGPENVGILMAQQRGYFAARNLEVWVRTPVSPLRPIQYVASGEVDFSISHQPQVELAQEKGVPVESVGSLISQPTAAMIWLKRSGIEGIADLKGRTIAIPGLPFQKEFLERVLARAGLTLADVEVWISGYELVPELVSGRADAIFGGTWNIEGAELEARGLEPVVTRARDLGIPPFHELVLIAHTGRFTNDPRPLRDFIAAVDRGTAAAIEDPEAAARLISLRSGEPRGKALEAKVESTLPLLSGPGE